MESPVHFGEQKGDSCLSLGGLDRHLDLKRGQMGWEKALMVSKTRCRRNLRWGDSRSLDVRTPHWSLWALLEFTELVGSYLLSKGH